jgi:hypothetical protein
MYSLIDVEISGRDRPSDFDKGIARLTIHLLHGKCARQELLEGFPINGEIIPHNRGAAILRLQN